MWRSRTIRPQEPSIFETRCRASRGRRSRKIGRGPTLAAALLGLLAATPAAAAPVAREVADRAGIAETTRTWSANVHDFNGDGWDDVLIVRHNEAPARLYRNDGGTFAEVNWGLFHQPGIPENPDEADRHDCAWADVDLDGRSDVYCTLGAEHGTVTKTNELWMQHADGTFVDRAAEYGVTDPLGRGRHATFIDVNRDPYPDLYVGNG